MTLDSTIPDDVAATHRAMWALGDYAPMGEEVMARWVRSWSPRRVSGRVSGYDPDD